jgi:O-antigen/teichoic acid export membrane protein
VARNTAYSAVGELSNLLIFLLGFLAARYLAPTEFGHFSAALAFVGLFRILPDFGMSYASALAIAGDRSLAARLIGNVLGFQGLMSALTLAACLGLGRVLFHEPANRLTWIGVLVLSFDLLLKTLKSSLRWLLKGLERFGVEAASLLVERALLLALGTASLVTGQGLVGFVLVFVFVRALDTAALWLFVRARVVPLRPSFDGTVWLRLLRQGLPFAYAGVVITLIFQVDAVMLEQMRGAREVGFYSAPVKVLEGLTLVPRILGYALIPTLVVLHRKASPGLTALYRRGLKYLLVAGLPVAAFGVMASDRFIPFLFGPAYLPSVPVARVLIPAALFMFLSNFGETALACIDRRGTIVVVSTLALALNVGLNLAWIPTWGYRGAAWATLLTEAAYLVLTAAALARYGQPAGWPRLALRPLLATAVFAAALATSRGLGLLWASVIASAAFAAATLALGVWDAREWALARGLLRGAAPDPAGLAGAEDAPGGPESAERR